jgi:hypothetical protein
MPRLTSVVSQFGHSVLRPAEPRARST